ncbi:MAG TPA: hypothetical protein ENI42_06010 [Thermoplasmatales archaeon]|nr:hypothetical protein [Thermoplasmatales archaeon]
MRLFVLTLMTLLLLATPCVALLNDSGIERYGDEVLNAIEAPNADVVKKAWDSRLGTWVDSVDAPVSSQIRFKVFVHNIGDYDLFDVVMIDTLPPFLTYVENSSNPREPDVIENNTLVWRISSLFHCCGGEEFEVQYLVNVTDAGYDANDLMVAANSSGGNIVKNDFSTVHAFYDTFPPSVEIKKPKRAFYVRDKEILPLFFTTIIVKQISVEVETSDMELGVHRVEFYVDDELKANDTVSPYVYVWDEKIFGQHTVRVVSYDLAGNHAEDSVVVWKIL